MKKYDLANYTNNKRAVINTECSYDPSKWYVLYYVEGKLDGSLKRTTTPHSGERSFDTEEKAIKSAIRYIK